MRGLLILTTLLTALCSTATCAWTEYYDGTALPTFDDVPWWLDNNGGEVSVAGGMMTCSAPANSWCDVGMWCGDGTGTPAIPTLVAGARLRVDSMDQTGMSLLVAATGATWPSTPLGFGILESGNFALVDYSGGPAAGQNNPIVLEELGPADNQWHTIYLLSAADGVWKAIVDGAFYSGVMGTNDWGEAVGYAEFSASTYWMNTRAVTISFDWFGYGGADSLPITGPTTVQLGAMKRASDGPIAFDNPTTPAVVTYVDVGNIAGEKAGKWFWVEQASREGGLGVSGLKVYAGSSAQHLPDGGLVVGDTITSMTGLLYSPGTAQNAYMDWPRELQLTEKPTKGASADDRGFFSLNVRSFGGGWLSDAGNPGPGDGTPPVIDSPGPPAVPATGLNTEGVLVKVAGKVVGYGDSGDSAYMWCWIDDGSGTVSDVSGTADYPPATQMTGIKCVRLFSFADNWPRNASDVGRPACVTGLCSNRNIAGVGRIRMLHMRCVPGTGGFGYDRLDWLDD